MTRPASVGRALPLVLLLCTFALCGCGAVGPVANPENAPLRIENTQMFVTVENRSGLALREVKIQIVPVGRSTDFSIIVPRLENGEKRDFSLGNFRGRDGTPFNLRVSKPKTVKVSGTDINDKVVEVEVPWR
jgi:hypothetical protein